MHAAKRMSPPRLPLTTTQLAEASPTPYRSQNAAVSASAGSISATPIVSATRIERRSASATGAASSSGCRSARTAVRAGRRTPRTAVRGSAGQRIRGALHVPSSRAEAERRREAVERLGDAGARAFARFGETEPAGRSTAPADRRRSRSRRSSAELLSAPGGGIADRARRSRRGEDADLSGDDSAVFGRTRPSAAHDGSVDLRAADVDAPVADGVQVVRRHSPQTRGGVDDARGGSNAARGPQRRTPRPKGSTRTSTRSVERHPQAVALLRSVASRGSSPTAAPRAAARRAEPPAAQARRTRRAARGRSNPAPLDKRRKRPAAGALHSFRGE